MSTPTGATFAERQAFVRTAAFKAVAELGSNFSLGEDVLARILDQTSGLGHSDLQARAAELARAYVKDIAAKPLNITAATREQLEERRRLAMGLSGQGVGEFGQRVADASNRSGGQGRTATQSSANYDGINASQAGMADPNYMRSVGLGGMIGAQLAALGFRSREQVAQIVGDANKLNLAPREAALDLARLRKAEGERTDSHIDALKRYGDGLRELAAERRDIAKIKDPKERAERERRAAEKERKIEEELKEHRDHDVRTPDGKKSFDRLRDKKRAQSQHDVQLRGDRAVHDKTQDERRAEFRKLGGERRVEEARRRTVAELKKKPDTEQAERDLIAGAVQDTRTAENRPIPPQPNPTTPAKKERVAQADPTEKKAPTAEHKAPDGVEPTKPQRQAVNHKALNPTV